MSIKRCSKCGKFKSNTPQFYYRAVENHDGLKKQCKTCTAAYAKQYHRDTAVARAACKKQYNKDNATARAAYGKQYRKNNAAAKAAYAKQYCKDNLSSYAARTAKRNAAKLLRTVKWSDYHAIARWYKLCPEGYAVDHIVPLQGKTVSGLHVHNNLQYLTQGMNSSKGNKYNDWSEYTRAGRRKRKNKA